MSRYNFYDFYTPTKPIKTDEGIKAHSKRGDFVKNWWATRWIKALERLVDKGRLQRGRRYARAGQVIALDERKGSIAAKVQGSSPRPYAVSIEVDPLTETEWDKVIDALADQAIFTVQLLAGEMPPDIEEAFTDAGVSLFPETAAQLRTDCSCPDWANPCKHVAAVHYILGEQFDEDPFLLFRLRGRSQEQLLADLRTRRIDETDDVVDEDIIEDRTMPLPDRPDAFWANPQPGQSIRPAIARPTIPYPLLKRLGQPTFLRESLDIYLGSTYQAITKAAIALTNRPESPSDD